MKKIYIYGASGHGKVVADIALACGYDKIEFLDDNSNKKFNESLDRSDIIIAIGNNKIRKFLQEKVESFGFNVVSLIHPSAIISKSASIEKGCAIMPNVIVNANAKISKGVILNSACIVEHDCQIGEFAHISPNSALAGGVRLGALSHMGISSCAIQCVEIGQNCVIGAGGVVTKNLDSNGVYVGVPAKFLKPN